MGCIFYVYKKREQEVFNNFYLCFICANLWLKCFLYKGQHKFPQIKTNYFFSAEETTSNIINSRFLRFFLSLV